MHGATAWNHGPSTALRALRPSASFHLGWCLLVVVAVVAVDFFAVAMVVGRGPHLHGHVAETVNNLDH